MKNILRFLALFLISADVFAVDENFKREHKVVQAEVLIKLYKDGRHDVLLKKSSGSNQIDEKIINAVKKATFKPIEDKKVEYPILITQPFEIELDDNYDFQQE
ncbi:energy transducer TonB [Acinetobacter sp. TUM15071]|uniref:energy transducer TonB family protein n=1 Tax=Acinetobacter sp. TUM15071 TaxID=2609135 RepID=UPI00124ECBCF|nr:energy transducer TonB [Acinetobacter sp. TUM15071]